MIVRCRLGPPKKTTPNSGKMRVSFTHAFEDTRVQHA